MSDRGALQSPSPLVDEEAGNTPLRRDAVRKQDIAIILATLALLAVAGLMLAGQAPLNGGAPTAEQQGCVCEEPPLRREDEVKDAMDDDFSEFLRDAIPYSGLVDAYRVGRFGQDRKYGPCRFAALMGSYDNYCPQPSEVRSYFDTVINVDTIVMPIADMLFRSVENDIVC